jgi:homoserine O-acetyltransferase
MFKSSDDIRSKQFSDHIRYLNLPQKLILDSGFELDECVIAYETYGDLNEDKSNGILICHAISGDSHVAKHDEKDIEGWWDILVGPGKYIDTNKFFVICSNILGSCMGSTGPNHKNNKTGMYWGSDFPEITVSDMVLAQSKLIEYLGINKLVGVVGGSLGAYQALEWGVRFPGKTNSVLSLAGGPRLTSQGIAFDIIGRNAIRRDPNFNNGQYYENSESPDTGLALARMLGHITYLSQESMSEKFDHDRYDPRDIDTNFEKQFSVGSYLAYQGDKFVERFDPNSYIILSNAMDKFDLGKNSYEISKKFKDKNLNWFLISFSSDWLFPTSMSKELTKSLFLANEEVNFVEIPSNCGHDAFLLEDDIHYYGNYISNFIENLLEQNKSVSTEEHKLSFDHELILDFVLGSKKIVDLGCGDGKLLNDIKNSRYTENLLGIDNDLNELLETSNKGIPILSLDLNKDLHLIGDKQFDKAILSLTLQAIINVEKILNEICRISEEVILSFPNFAFGPLRDMLSNQGRAPKLEGVLGYEWYNTPNKRYMSILDFEDFCNEKNFNIIKSRYVNSSLKQFITKDYNYHADLGIFIISK